MILTILILLLFAISIGFAVLSDKKREKFQFNMLPNEKIEQTEIDVTFFGKNNEYSKSGLLYLTNKRLVFFKYKFGILEFIPLIGSTLVSVFIDKKIFWEFSVNQIITYHFKPTIIKNNNGRVLRTIGETKFFTLEKQSIDFDIPLKYDDHTKADLLVKLDVVLNLKK